LGDFNYGGRFERKKGKYMGNRNGWKKDVYFLKNHAEIECFYDSDERKSGMLLYDVPIRKWSPLVDVLYLFVVEEDKSIFSFQQRLSMVREGVKEYNNVLVIPSGDFMISTLTFPGYFMKDNPARACYDTFLDLKIFAHYVAPAFGIESRFVGCEPFDKVTAQYNHDMKIILQAQGIMVIEIPRKEVEGQVISATVVRKLLMDKDWTKLERFVPASTLEILKLNK